MCGWGDGCAALHLIYSANRVRKGYGKVMEGFGRLPYLTLRENTLSLCLRLPDSAGWQVWQVKTKFTSLL